MGLMVVQLKPVRPPARPPEGLGYRRTKLHAASDWTSHVRPILVVRLHRLCELFFMWISFRWSPSASPSSRQKNSTAVCEEAWAPVQGCNVRA